MKCPDCKIEMELKSTEVEVDNQLVRYEPHWRCSKCKIEVSDD